jgi:hypothetical protein
MLNRIRGEIKKRWRGKETIRRRAKKTGERKIFIINLIIKRTIKIIKRK